jgi:hypothetical protein
MRLIELFNVLERKKFRQPLVMYHGTSDVHLRGILKQGVVPSAEEKVWATDKEVQAFDFSRASLEGSYWTSNMMTARSSSTTARNTFGGEPLLVIARIAESSAYADEDSMTSTIQRALPEMFNSLREQGQGLIPEAAIKSAALIYFGGWNEEGFSPEAMLNAYAKILHEYLAADAAREPVDMDLMKRMMEAHMMRQLAYANEHEGDGYYKDQYAKEMNRLADEGKVPPIPSLTDVEATIKGLQNELTRKYRKTALASHGDFAHTLRITEPVTFRGANKIICILGDLANWKEMGYEQQYKAPLVLYYGTPPPDFFEQYKQRVGEWHGAVNPQGQMVIPPADANSQVNRQVNRGVDVADSPVAASIGMTESSRKSLREAKLFHGTPNEVQGEFSTDYMSTGEGGQAYGWGLYFAEEPLVAKAYADTLGAEHGRIYAVEIPDEILEQFLDFTSPVTENVIEKILASQGMTMDDALLAHDEFDKFSGVVADAHSNDKENWPAMSDKWMKMNKRLDIQLGGMIKKLREPIGTFGYDPKKHQDGQQLYRSLARALGGDRQASEYLNGIGIPGIKFLDAESRQGKASTYNYVAFDGSITRNLGQVHEW